MKTKSLFYLFLISFIAVLAGCGQQQEEFNDIPVEEDKPAKKPAKKKPAFTMPWAEEKKGEEDEEGDEEKRSPEDIQRDKIAAIKNEIADKKAEKQNIREEERKISENPESFKDGKLGQSKTMKRRSELRKRSVQLMKEIKRLKLKYYKEKRKLAKMLKAKKKKK